MENSVEIANRLLSQLKTTNSSFKDKTVEDILFYVETAESDICLFLRCDSPLPKKFHSKIYELAKIRALKDISLSAGLKNKSYSEGSVSKSETYLTAEDYEKQEDKIFSDLKPYRGCRIVT